MRAPRIPMPLSAAFTSSPRVRCLHQEFAFLSYLDLNPALFDSAGKAKVDLYLHDMLHFKPPAYVAFTTIVKPVLTKAWASQ